MSTWYTVKSLYRMEVLPTGASEPRLSSFEERVVLIRASSFDEAMAKAEAEARTYQEEGAWTNKRGERVRTRFLGAVSAFAMADDVSDGVELHSSILFVDPSVSDDQIVERMLGAVSEQSSTEQGSFEPDLGELS